MSFSRYPTILGTQRPIISRYLDDVGNGTGNKEAIGNYSGGAVDFKIAPPAGQVYRIHRMIVTLQDAGGMSAAEYGNTGTVLTNGIQVLYVDSSGTITDFTDGVPIKVNAQWASICYDVDIKGWGGGEDILVARLTFANAGQVVRLVGNDSGELIVRVNDDLTGLTAHRFKIQGYRER